MAGQRFITFSLLSSKPMGPRAETTVCLAVTGEGALQASRAVASVTCAGKMIKMIEAVGIIQALVPGWWQSER